MATGMRIRTSSHIGANRNGTSARVGNAMGKGLQILQLPFVLMQFLGLGAFVTKAGSKLPVVGGALDKVSGVLAWVPEKMQTPLDKAIGTKGLDSIAGPMARFQQTVGNVLGSQARAGRKQTEAIARLDEIHTQLNQQHPEMGAVWERMQEVAKAAKAGDAAAYQKANEAMQTELLKHVQPPEGFFAGVKQMFTGGDAATKAARKYQGAIQENMNAAEKVNFWQNPVDVTKQRLQRMTVGDVVGGALRYGYIAHSMIGGYRQVKGGIAAMKQLYKDVTGKNISTWKLLTGSVPPIVQKARREYLRGVLPGAGLLIGGAVAQHKVYQVMDRKFGDNPMVAHLGSMAVFKGMDMAHGFFAGQQGFTQVYEQIHLAENQGMELDANAYLTLIVAGSASLQHKGGVYSQNAQNIAIYMAENKLSVAEVVQILNKGEKELMALSHEGKAIVEHYQQQSTEASSQLQQAGNGKWANQMKMGGSPLRAEKGGKYTEMVDESRIEANLQRA